MDWDAGVDFQAPSRCDWRPDLPDPLKTTGDDPIETVEGWRDRRDVIERQFRHYVYGYAPESPELETTITSETPVLDGAGVLREVEIVFPALPADAPTIGLAVVVPTEAVEADRSVPVLLGLNAFGTHAAIDDPAVTITDAGRAIGAERGAMADAWCVDRVLARGYAFATYHLADVDPDRSDAAGLTPYFDNELPGPPGTEWGAIAAWAWGLQRCVDYLRSVETVRPDAIAVTGHSRCGKAALLAGATDERIGLLAPHQSGTGGVTLARDNGQESVGDITGGFPHWFADTFAAFAGQVERLPVDQHLLVALVAPRPLLDTEGSRDYWTNPGRALDSLEAASPVWDLHDVEGLPENAPLSDEEITAETVGRLCQYRRETAHTLEAGYVDAILDFADVHFGE